jgi:hypothetical protein
MKKKFPVLVLFDTIGIPGCATPAVWPRAQLTAFYALDAPPADLREHVQIFIKVHPGFPDVEILKTVTTRLHGQILPPDSDLHTALEHFGLVISTNYFGSAFLHALRAGKAVILFWTDSRNPWNIHYGKRFLSSGITVYNAKELWQAVRDYFTKPEFAEHLHQKGREFQSRYLDDSSYPTIGEVIDRILAKKGKPGDFSLTEKERSDRDEQK